MYYIGRQDTQQIIQQCEQIIVLPLLGYMFRLMESHHQAVQGTGLNGNYNLTKCIYGIP
jgi:hypothetical protein